MAITLNPATLNTFNLGLNDLDNKLNDVIKKRTITPTLKTYIDIYEQSTHASTTDQYNIPEFNEELINNLTNDNNIIYNKKHKQETYLNNALFYMLYTKNGRTVKINAYGYKPPNYKYIEQLGNLYFVSCEWFILFKTDPFNINQFYKLTDIIYNNE